MIVVADTTPLNYLVLIGQIDLLPALYRRVLIPAEVHRELLGTRTSTKLGIRDPFMVRSSHADIN